MDGVVAYILAAAALTGIAAAAALALRRLSDSPDDPAELPPAGIPEFSARMYAPVERLFDPADLLFLRQQPGYSKQIEAKFRRQRAGVFRQYLCSMERDYKVLHRAARSIAAQGLGHPDLSAKLVEMQIMFQRTLLRARFEAFCFERGWRQPVVSLQPVVGAMVAVRVAMSPKQPARSLAV